MVTKKKVSRIENPISKHSYRSGLVGYRRRLSQMENKYFPPSKKITPISALYNPPKKFEGIPTGIPGVNIPIKPPVKEKRYYPISDEFGLGMSTPNPVGYKTPLEAYMARFNNPYDHFYEVSSLGTPLITHELSAIKQNKTIKVLYVPYDVDIAFYNNYFAPEKLQAIYNKFHPWARDDIDKAFSDYFSNYSTARLKIMRPTNRAFRPESEHTIRHRSNSSRSRRTIPVLSDRHGIKKYGSSFERK